MFLMAGSRAGRRGSSSPRAAMETVEQPALSPVEGTYSSSQSVSMTTATVGATTRYTTDGTDPTLASPIYTTPLTVAVPTEIRAFSTKSGMLSSPITTGVYTIAGATPFIIITGESNAAGYALNTELTAGELASRSLVKILNNTGLVFEDLDIGTNANIGQGLDNTTSGAEAGIANAVYAERFKSPATAIYLMKSAQTGSRIAQWDVGQTNWTNFTTRYAAAASLLSAVTYQPYVLFSLGLNDALAAMSTASWKAAVIAHFAKIRALIGSTTIIVATKFGEQITQYPLPLAADYNTALDEIAASDSYTFAMDTSDLAGMRDSLHWNAQSQRIIAERFVDRIQPGAQISSVSASLGTGSYFGSQTETLTGPNGSTVRRTEDGSTPHSGSTATTGSFSVGASKTIKAFATRPGFKSSPVSTFTYAITLPLTWDTTNKSGNITLSNGNLDAVSGGGAGFNTVIGSSGYSSGKRYFELKVVGFDGTNQNYILAGVSSGVPGNLNTYVGTAGNPGVSLQFASSRLINTFIAGTGTFHNLALNSVIGVCVDMDAGKITLGFNNNFDPLSNGCNPVTGTNPFATFTPGATLYPSCSLYQNNPTNKVQILSQGSLTYSPPSGFSSW